MAEEAEDPSSPGGSTETGEATDPAGQATAESGVSDASSVVDASAKSSTASDAKAPGTELDAVRAALARKPEAEGESSGPKTLADKPADAADAAADTSDDKPPPFHEHPRWKQVVAERDGLKTENASLKVGAEQYGKITGFLDRFGISDKEYVDAMGLLAQVKADPRKAVNALIDVVTALRRQLGDEIPTDLQAKVDSGAITEDDALELSRLRAAHAAQGQHLRATTEAATAAERERAARDNHASLTAAMDADEAATIKRDPDYAIKAPWIAKAIKAYQADGEVVRTPQESVAIYRRAYKEVSEAFRSVRPQPRATDSVRRLNGSTGGSISATDARPAPTTELDVVRRALGH